MTQESAKTFLILYVTIINHVTEHTVDCIAKALKSVTVETNHIEKCLRNKTLAIISAL